MGIYSIGLTALRAAQFGQLTTGNNIANVNTPGYRRQEILQVTNATVQTGSGFIGQGVAVATVQRIYDGFVERQVIQNEAESAYYSQYLQGMRQIDSVLGDRASGVSATLEQFFSSWNNLANHPSSTTARQGVLGAANTLANSINQLGEYLKSLQASVNAQIQSLVSKINGYATSLVELNQRIDTFQGIGQTPNDLLDQRDQVVSELNQLVGVSVIKDATSGSYSIFMAGGYLLVSPAGANLLSAESSRYDPSRLEVYGGQGGLLLSSGGRIGGQLGGLLDFRTESLDTAENALGRLYITLASHVNALHTTGRDPNGNLGGVFFNNPASLPQAWASTTNTGTGVVTAQISNAAQLTTSDYRLAYDGTNYTLTRLADGQSWSNASIAALGTLAAQGFSLAISGTPAAGDSFYIRPAAAGATNAAVAISNPAAIAAAHNSAVAGDILDNRNALAIAALRNDASLVAGNNTLEGAYALLVGEVGNKTNEIGVKQKTQQNLLDQARKLQQSISGVNLDEEAANLIRYQQAYQAAAKVIATANTMFDAILQIA